MKNGKILIGTVSALALLTTTIAFSALPFSVTIANAAAASAAVGTATVATASFTAGTARVAVGTDTAATASFTAGTTTDGTAIDGTATVVVQRVEVPSNDRYKDNCVLWIRTYRLPELPFGLWTLNDKVAIINEDTASPGCAAIIGTAQGHVAYVEKVEGAIVSIIESNWGSARITRASGTEEELRILGYFNPKKPLSGEQSNTGVGTSTGLGMGTTEGGEDGGGNSDGSTGSSAGTSSGTDASGTGSGVGDGNGAYGSGAVDASGTGSGNGSGAAGTGGPTGSVTGTASEHDMLPLITDLSIELPGFTDISRLTADELKALSALTHLELIKGYGDGTFLPYAQMSRAEFTALTVKLFMPDLIRRVHEQEISPTLLFSDVPRNNWAFDYVYLGAESGMISGTGDDTFSPGTPVLYPHAVKMLIYMLGYSDNAASGGGYPSGYLRVANKLGFDNGFGFSGSGDNLMDVAGKHPLSRIDAAVLIFNAMDTKFNRQDTSVYAKYFAE